MTATGSLKPRVLPLRQATRADLPALVRLVEESFRALCARDYPAGVVAAAAGTLIKFEPALLEEGRVFVIEDGGVPVACAGWTGYQDWLAPDLCAEDGHLVAVVRSVFVAPGHAGRGLGRRLMTACHDDAAALGRREAWLMATLTGVPLYRRCGYETVGIRELPLATGGSIRGLLMRRPLAAAASPARAA